MIKITNLYKENRKKSAWKIMSNVSTSVIHALCSNMTLVVEVFRISNRYIKKPIRCNPSHLWGHYWLLPDIRITSTGWRLWIRVTSHERDGISNHRHIDCFLNTWGESISRGRWSPLSKGPVMRKMFPCHDDVTVHVFIYMCIHTRGNQVVTSTRITGACNHLLFFIMTSSNGNLFRVTGHLWGNPLVTGGFPLTKGRWRRLRCYLLSASLNKRLHKQSSAGDLRRHDGHCDVTVMWCTYAIVAFIAAVKIPME